MNGGKLGVLQPNHMTLIWTKVAGGVKKKVESTDLEYDGPHAVQTHCSPVLLLHKIKKR